MNKKILKISGALLILLLILAVGVWAAWIFFRFQNSQKKGFDPSHALVPSILYTETGELVCTEDHQKAELSLDLLRQANQDVAAILEFDDRLIYEPIVQAERNDQYVNRDLFGNRASVGISFIDCGSSLDSQNTVIYGHSSVYRNIIFTPLMQYKEKAFWQAHPTFDLHDGETDTYQIFSVFLYDSKDPDQAPDFVVSNWDDQQEYEVFLDCLTKRSLYETKVALDGKDKIITLITCDTKNKSQKLIVIGKRQSD